MFISHFLFRKSWCGRGSPRIPSALRVFQQSIFHRLPGGEGESGAGLIIQALMIAAVLVYYFVPAAQSWFLVLANAKSHWGYAFSLASAVIAGGVLPVMLRVAIVQRGRFTRADLSEMLFLAMFWGSEGLVVDAFIDCGR